MYIHDLASSEVLVCTPTPMCILVSHPLIFLFTLVVVLRTIRPKMLLGLDIDINTWLFTLPLIIAKHRLHCWIPCPSKRKWLHVHHPIRNLELASAYYNKIFQRISGPPKWLTRNLQQAFKQVETANGNAFLQYNPNWEIPKTPVPTKQCCNHPLFSGSSTLCTCLCCHYRCPTHSAKYYGFSY